MTADLDRHLVVAGSAQALLSCLTRLASDYNLKPNDTATLQADIIPALGVVVNLIDPIQGYPTYHYLIVSLRLGEVVSRSLISLWFDPRTGLIKSTAEFDSEGNFLSGNIGCSIDNGHCDAAQFIAGITAVVESAHNWRLEPSS